MRFENFIQEHIDVFSRLRELEAAVQAASQVCARALSDGRKVMFCGNGGSAADAQHIAAELVGRLVDDRPALSGLALTTDSSALTCISNDYGYDDVFARQISGLGCTGDVLVAISTSGNSQNVIKAVAEAKARGMSSIGWLGREGGKLATLVDIAIVVPSDVTARIQEAHIFIGHVMCAQIEKLLGHGSWGPEDE